VSFLSSVCGNNYVIEVVFKNFVLLSFSGKLSRKEIFVSKNTSLLPYFMGR